MYLRFVVAEIHADSQRDVGVFHAARWLRGEGRLLPYEESHLRTVTEWFDVHLDQPTRFTASKPPHYRKTKRAISWFKDTAHEHISRVREIVALLEGRSFSSNAQDRSGRLRCI